jgi:hypothetical protein
MALRDEILVAFPGLTAATRDDGAIATALSAGRTRLCKTEVGFGTVLSTLGPVDGSALLDTLSTIKATNRPLYWAWYLLERGVFDFGTAAAQAQMDGLVAAGVLSAVNAEKLKALGVEPVTVSPQEVAKALEGYFDA